MKLFGLLLSCLAAALMLQPTYAHDSPEFPDYHNPVQSADQDEIKNLPGLSGAINSKHYSGYVRADNNTGLATKFFHYWFVESQRTPSSDPILLWMNGAPGCSSLNGLFLQIGPFSVTKNTTTTERWLESNELAWNRFANILFLDSPTGTGFSYTTNSSDIYHDDDSTARENYMALKWFMEKFPQYSNNPLYLIGEEYAGGVYMPMLGLMLDADPKFNLNGIAVGNGYLDAAKVKDSRVFFSYHHGLVGHSTWDKVSFGCCNSRPPARESCRLTGDPNVSGKCLLVVDEIAENYRYSGLNPLNLYKECETNVLAADDDYGESLQYESSSTTTNDGPVSDFIHCLDDHSLVDYLSSDQARVALHIPEDVSQWTSCRRLHYVRHYPLLPGGMAPQMKQLIDSKRNLSLLVYNGDTDTICNFLGSEWFVDDLGRQVVQDYTPWKVDGQVAGFYKVYDGIALATVRGAGHLVPADRPLEALSMLGVYLNTQECNIDQL